MTDAAFPEPTSASPPRFWWLKRNIMVSIALVIAFGGAMIWWQAEAQRRLNAEVAAIRARGEPILIEDFAVAPVPDDENAALSLTLAASSITLTQAEARFVVAFESDSSLDQDQMTMLRQIAQANTKPRQLARQARFQRKADWGVKLTSQIINMNRGSLFRPHRDLARLQWCSAMLEHVAGHDAEAIEIVRDMLRQSDLMQQHSPGLVTHLVAIGIAEVTVDTARVLSYDLRVLGESSATTRPDGPASRQQIQSLIAELLDESAYRRGFQYAMYGERLMQYDLVVSGIRGTPMSPSAWHVQAMFKLEVVRMMRAIGRLAAVAEAPDYPSANKLLPAEAAADYRFGVTPVIWPLRIVSMVGMSSYPRFVESHFRGLGERRVAALRLALRLHMLDHDGKLPDDLSQLVPVYLPALPADPFASDGRTFGYRRQPDPIVYSVGRDGNDDGGDPSLPVSRRKPYYLAPIPGSPFDRVRWERADVIFRLDRVPPPPSEETTTQD